MLNPTLKPMLNPILKSILHSGLVKEQYVARLDGATKYWQLTDPITAPENSNLKLTFYVKGIRDAYEGLFENSIDSHKWVRLLPSSQSANIQGYDGVAYFQSELLIRDNTFHKVSFIREVDKLSIQIDDGVPEVVRSSGAGAAWAFDRLAKFSSSYLQGVIYGFEFELEGVVVHEISLTNKAQGATQLATVGSINATMINYTGGEWEPLP